MQFAVLKILKAGPKKHLYNFLVLSLFKNKQVCHKKCVNLGKNGAKIIYTHPLNAAKTRSTI